MTDDPANNRPEFWRADGLRLALRNWTIANQNWVDVALDLANQLKWARDECGCDDRAFGGWLADNEIDVGLDKDTRAAFLKMAEHPDVSREVLTRTERRSIRLIWAHEIRPLVEPRSAREQQDGQDLSQPCDRSCPAQSPKSTPPPSRPDVLTIGQDEREAARADAERRQQQAAAAFEADQAARRAQDAAAAEACRAAAVERYAVAIAAWDAFTAEERSRFRAYIDG